jgi:hypothetical protein
MWLSRWRAVAFIPLSPAARSRSARGENAVEVPPRLLRPPRADSGLINRGRPKKSSARRREENSSTPTKRSVDFRRAPSQRGNGTGLPVFEWLQASGRDARD